MFHPDGYEIHLYRTSLADIEWIRAEAAARGHAMPAGSPFDRQLQDLARLAEGHLSGVSSAAFWRRALGTRYFLRVLRRASRTRSWDAIARTWLSFLAGEDDVGLIEISPTADDGRSRDAVWELLAACIMASHCEDVHYEEPDIACMFRHAKFGVACKFAYSNNRRTQLDAIMKGVRQLEDSECEYGVVLVNVTNLIPHDLFLPEPPSSGERSSIPAAAAEDHLDQLKSWFKGYRESVLGGDLVTRVTLNRRTGADRPKTRSILALGQTVAAVARASGDADLVLLSPVLEVWTRDVSAIEQDFFEALFSAASPGSVSRWSG